MGLIVIIILCVFILACLGTISDNQKTITRNQGEIEQLLQVMRKEFKNKSWAEKK